MERYINNVPLTDKTRQEVSIVILIKIHSNFYLKVCSEALTVLEAQNPQHKVIPHFGKHQLQLSSMTSKIVHVTKL